MHRFFKLPFIIGMMSMPLSILLTASVHAMEPLLSGFQSPVGIVTAPDGSIFVSDWSANTVTRVDPSGKRSTFARDIPAAAGLALDPSGALFVASYSGNYIVRIAPDGQSRRVAEMLSTPTGISFARNGRLLVANRGSGEIVSIDVATGQVLVVAQRLSLPVGVVEMEDGSLVASQYGGRVTRITPDGKHQELGVSFNRPGVGILVDGKDAVFVVDNGASAVRRVTLEGKSTVVASDLAGSAVALGRGRGRALLVGTWGTGSVFSIQP